MGAGMQAEGVAVGTGATGRVCEACATNCKRCSAPGVCTECENGKSLHGGTCVDDCTATTPAASLAAGSRRQASVGAVAFAVADPNGYSSVVSATAAPTCEPRLLTCPTAGCWKSTPCRYADKCVGEYSCSCPTVDAAGQQVYETPVCPASTPGKLLYLGHGYSVKAAASLGGASFSPTFAGVGTTWTEAYASATLSDVCSKDVWSANTGPYCTGGSPLGNGTGVDCCTNKWGKQMVLRVCSQTTSGAASCATGGFTTRAGKTAAQGSYLCGSTRFGPRLDRGAGRGGWRGGPCVAHAKGHRIMQAHEAVAQLARRRGGAAALSRLGPARGSSVNLWAHSNLWSVQARGISFGSVVDRRRSRARSGVSSDVTCSENRVLESTSARKQRSWAAVMRLG